MSASKDYVPPAPPDDLPSFFVDYYPGLGLIDPTKKQLLRARIMIAITALLGIVAMILWVIAIARI